MAEKAVLGKQIVVRMINKSGTLADISGILYDCGLNIEAVNGYAIDDIATITFITDDNLRAAEALKKAGYTDCKEKEVIIIELQNRIGGLKNISTKLANEGIDINYIHAGVCPIGSPAKIALSTDNNESALKVLEVKD